MTVALIACLVVVTIGFLVLLDRKDKRAHIEREADRRERADLMQRIQAPELAVVRHDVEQAVELPQPPQTDEDYWKQSDEQAAAIAALEARENALFDRA